LIFHSDVFINLASLSVIFIFSTHLFFISFLLFSNFSFLFFIVSNIFCDSITFILSSLNSTFVLASTFFIVLFSSLCSSVSTSLKTFSISSFSLVSFSCNISNSLSIDSSVLVCLLLALALNFDQSIFISHNFVNHNSLQIFNTSTKYHLILSVFTNLKSLIFLAEGIFVHIKNL
jgi:hypothetical protein